MRKKTFSQRLTEITVGEYPFEGFWKAITNFVPKESVLVKKLTKQGAKK